MSFNNLQKYPITSSYLPNNGDLILSLPNTTINDQQLFRKQLKADIFLTLKRTSATFPLHSFRVINHSKFLRMHYLQRNIIIEENFKEQILTKILSLFYGFQICANRSSITSYYSIIHFLQIESLLKMIEQDMYNNLAEYDMFIVLQLSYIYRLNELMDKCLRELLNQEFQQMRYNIYDLLKCSEEVFRLVIMHHNKMKMEGKISGFQWSQIQQIIKQYCQVNKLSTSKTAILLYELVDHKELFIEQRKKTSNCMEDGPKERIIAARQQHQLNKGYRKLSESFIPNEHFVTKTPLTPVRSSTFYSNIFGDTPKSENNIPSNKGAFTKKQTKEAPQINIITNQPSPQSNFLKNDKFKIKGGLSPIEIRAVSREQQSQEKQVHQRFVTQPDEVRNNNYLNINPKTPTPKSADSKAKQFKVWESQHKKPANKIVNKTKKLQEQPITQSRYINNNLPINSNSKIHTTIKDIKATQKIKQTQSLSNIKNNLEVMHKFQSNPNFNFGDQQEGKQESNQPKQISNLVKEEQQEFETTRMRARTVATNNNVRQGSAIYDKSRLPLQSKIKKDVRQKSQLIKDIEILNKQSEQYKRQSEQMLQQAKNIRDQFTQKDIRNQQYKRNLNRIDSMLKNLEKQFGEKQNSINILQQKVTNISRKIAV